MRRLATSLGILLTCMQCMGQSRMIDSLKVVIDTAKSDTSKARDLYLLSYYFQMYKPDSAMTFARSAFDLSSELKWARGEITSLGLIAGAYNKLGNYPEALKYFLMQLKLLEKQSDKEDLGTGYLSIAQVYSATKDIEDALRYAHKADSIAKAGSFHQLHLYTMLDIGDMYAKNGQLDSALVYTDLSFHESLQPDSTISGKDLLTATALNNKGNIYFKLNQPELAMQSYRSAIPLLIEVQDDNTLSECYLGLSQTFDRVNQKDSALYYASKSYWLASNNQFLQHALNASQALSALYRQRRNIDSAFVYQNIYIALKDSFDNAEKIKELQSRTLDEKARQNDMASGLVKAKKERRIKLELLLVGMFIPVFFFFSAYISRRRVHKRLIELSGVFSLIFLFEYVTLLIHPVVKEKVSQSPVIEIVIFVIIAAILSPVHHRVEYWLIDKLTKRHHHTMLKPREIKTEGKKKIT
jgi:tetratricopeptide (TPR) repeat protein